MHLIHIHCRMVSSALPLAKLARYAPSVDHSNPRIQADVKEYIKYLMDEVAIRESKRAFSGSRIQHCLCIISDQVNINSTALCFNFQFMKRFYWCRRFTWHYWALSSHLQSIALNQTCTTKTMGKLASKTLFPVLSCVFCALQIGFRALRFDFVKGYSARFQAVLNWDRAMYKGGMSLCALANMPRTSTYNIYIFPFSSIMLAVRLEF